VVVEPCGQSGRLAGMRAHPGGIAIVAVFALAILLGGCTAPNAFTAPFSPSAPPGAVGGAPPAGGGQSGGNTGDGGTVGGGSAGGGGAIQPGRPELVVPKPGQANVRPISIAELRALVDGDHVVVEARWWSGIAPCSVLDSVAVARDGNTFSVTVREGAQPGPAVACIEIAQYKGTRIDLGRLVPGSYTVRADPGDARPLAIVLPG
jgi:hypothetical protein